MRSYASPKPVDEELRASGGNTPALASDTELQQTKGPDGAVIDLSNIFVAKHEFRAEQPRQLSFPKKALIRILTKKDNGWWNGELLASLGGAVLATGWLPATYVRPYAAGATIVRLSRNGGALGFGIAGGKVCILSHVRGWVGTCVGVWVGCSLMVVMKTSSSNAR